MIDEKTYLESLARIEEKEKLREIAIENGVKFLETYKELLNSAKKEQKHIFLLFHMSGCDGCNVIKYNLENNKQLQNYLNKYIVLTCNVSEIKTDLTQKYNVYSYPACFIIDSNEKILKQKIGITVKNGPEKDLINWLLSK